MLKAFLNWRTYVLLVLVGLGLVLLMADLYDYWPNFAGFFLTVLTKIACGGVFYFAYKLLRYWEAFNLIPEITDIPDKY